MIILPMQRGHLPLRHRHSLRPWIALQGACRPATSINRLTICSEYSNYEHGILTQRLNQSEHHGFTGSEGQPEDGGAVAASIFTAVFVYIVRYDLRWQSYQTS